MTRNRLYAYAHTSVTAGFAFSSSDNGWPIPPAQGAQLESGASAPSGIPAAPRTTALTMLSPLFHAEMLLLYQISAWMSQHRLYENTYRSPWLMPFGSNSTAGTM